MASSSMQIIRLVAIIVGSIAILAHPAVAKISNQMLRKALRCPPCDDEACPLVSFSLACEPVMEPGVCSCCYQCARREGENCGMNTGRCGRGLSCRPLPGDPEPFEALMTGRAVCLRRAGALW